MDGTRKQWVLVGLAIGWAVVWLALHFVRPAAFPWLGMIGGFVIIIPLMIALRIEQRNKVGRENQDYDSHDNDTRT